MENTKRKYGKFLFKLNGMYVPRYSIIAKAIGVKEDTLRRRVARAGGTEHTFEGNGNVVEIKVY